ncbi:hypothetical protein H4F46_19285 [Pectobacterium brasiliense]|uniref:hypothetical protein n=1 Tax=Pectobacterium brasiliense TaxID=180957 RepID=UPI0019691FB1|nr:hypothetical protein [Pectobacterium brasiliense]MBN3117022.1 hypothetical protein [Pectobacterium brasiliense]
MISIMNVFILICVLYIMYRHVLFPKVYSIASGYDYRFFVFFYIVCLLGIGGIIATIYPDLNSVLKRTTENGFLLGSGLIFSFLIIYIILSEFFNVIERRYFSESLVSNNKYSSLNGISVFCCLSIFLTVVIICFYGFPQTLLFKGLSAYDLAYTRTTALHNSTLIPSFFRKILARDLSVFLSFVLYARFCLQRAENKKESKVRFLLILIFLCAVYNVSFELSKSKLVEYLLFLFLIRATVNYTLFRTKPKFFSLLFIFSGFTVLLIFIFSLAYPELELIDVINYFISRLFVSQISPFYYVSGVVFNNSEKLGDLFDVFTYVGEVFKITDFFAPAQQLTQRLFYDDYTSGTMNYLSTFFASDVLWSFGLWFFPFASIYVVFLLRFTTILRAYGFPREIFIGVSAVVFYGSNFMSSFFAFIFSSTIVFIMFVSFFVSKKLGVIVRK